MANYTQKLQNMKSRRRGLDSTVSFSSATAVLKALAEAETYETRATTNAVRYALGGMQEMDPRHTEISIGEGDRVKNQLAKGLGASGPRVSFEYQGSVPLNIHIRYSSDIDLLVLHDEFVTLDWSGPRAQNYTSSNISAADEVLSLRKRCEAILESQFPEVTVDKTGTKSIALSGGSLRRKVDVVPSHWHDTAAYQSSRAKHDREIRILDKEKRVTLANRPFLHMKRIDDKDSQCNGGAKKVIRLLKNLKRDSERTISLTSYDIASLVWHCSDASLNKPYYLELSLVAEVQQFLGTLASNPTRASELMVPDQSRKIFDSADKLRSLAELKSEVDELAADISGEIYPYWTNDRDVVRRRLLEAQIF